MIVIINFLILLCPSSIPALKNYYCALPCGEEQHTLCKYEPCMIDLGQCGRFSQMLRISHEERETILHMHNDFRNEMASKQIWPEIGTPSNLQVLSYDLELEILAQCWANICEYIGTHDPCRRTRKRKIIGQNIYMTKRQKTYLNASSALELAINSWKYENTSLTKELVKRFTFAKAAPVVNVAQLLWAKTIRVGCGRVRYGWRDISFYYIVCNYAFGLLEGQPIFEEGKNCSSCKCSEAKYGNLCGYILPVETSDWVEYFYGNFVQGRSQISGSKSVHIRAFRIAVVAVIGLELKKLLWH